jgi:hypothetical protein
MSTDTHQAQVIKNIGVVLEEAGTSWDYVMKTTVFLANMSDYAAMNSVYGAMLPSPKPARTAVEVGKLPGAFLIEIEAIAAIPDSWACGRMASAGIRSLGPAIFISDWKQVQIGMEIKRLW